MKNYSNVFQPELNTLNNGFMLKGKWRESFFRNKNPIILELGCGKGEYTVGLATKYPQKNFIGIDIKGARIWKGATETINKKINNVSFLRIRIEWIEQCFAENEIDEIWLTFPDPHIKKRRVKKRLTHPEFLFKYKNILKKKGLIHLKTDSYFLYGFTLGIIESEKHMLIDATHDIYNSKLEYEDMEIKTYYENRYLKKGLPITYICFSFR